MMRILLAGLVVLGAALPAAGAPGLVGSDSLVALAEARIRASIGPLPEGGSLECRALLAPEPVESAGPFEIVTHLAEARPAALMTPVIRVTSGDRVVRSIPIPFRLRLVGPRLRAARPLTKGEPLTPDAVRVAIEELAFPWDEPLTDPAQAEGLVLRRALGAGEVVRSDLLERPTLVRSGEPVLLALESSAVRILARGIARGNGRLGDTIPIVRDGERRQLRVVVTGPGRVTLRLNSLSGEGLEISRSNASPDPEGAFQ